MQQTFEFIDTLNFSDNERVWNWADMFTLIVETYWALIRDHAMRQSEEVANRLKQFYLTVEQISERGGRPQRRTKRSDSVVDYYRSVLQATNDRGNRIRRGEIISALIRA